MIKTKLPKSLKNMEKDTHSSTKTDQKKARYERDVMLAHSYTGQIDPTGWWFSEKYDGVRALWTGDRLIFGRNGTPIAAPQFFLDYLPENIPLDGELYIRRDYFNETSGFVRKKTPIDQEWKQIRFMVFDLPTTEFMPYEKRLRRLKKTGLKPPIEIVEPILIESQEHLKRMHQDLISKGAEGSMIRAPRSPYQNTRSHYLLKVKEQRDEDAIVIGWEVGHNRNHDRLGALQIKWNNPEEIQDKYSIEYLPDMEFKVGAGFKDTDRCHIGDASEVYPVGTLVKVAFNGLQKSGKPRYPMFKGIREPITDD
jgi:DNA ligase-1